MTLAIMRAMALTLLRDRGALAMTFVLPALLFLLFAAIFGSTGGENAIVTVAAARQSPAAGARDLVAALARAPDIRLAEMSADAVEAAVASGAADVGLVVREDPGAVTQAPPLVVITDPGREVAAALLTARIQRTLAEDLPGLAMRRVAGQIAELAGPFTPEQQGRLDEAIAHARELTAGGAADLMLRRAVAGHGAADAARPGVTYYAGAIAMLFLLFSAVQGAASLVDERRSGVFERIVMTHGGVTALVNGKFLFLVLQGVALAAVLFTVAQLVYGVDALGRLGAWLAVATAAAAAAAGGAMPLAAASRTRQQAQTLSTFAVLLLSALGGSMVPRFLMPDWLQTLGVLTPNAWGIEAYQHILWRGADLSAVLPQVGVLLGIAVAGWGLTLWLVRRYVSLA